MIALSSSRRTSSEKKMVKNIQPKNKVKYSFGFISEILLDASRIRFLISEPEKVNLFTTSY